MLRGALLCSLLVACGHDALVDDPLDELIALDGVISVEERSTNVANYRLFVIQFEQPVDHASPGSSAFPQLVTLLHRSYDAPTVLASTGYHNFLVDRPVEPTFLLDANQLVVEHRYFADSRPDPVDWLALTIEQAATDHHRIVSALAPLYTGPWVSAGASKGGMTAVFHRRYYPEDVDATIAYVAPISFAAPDARYAAFFDTVGDTSDHAACRSEVRALQRLAMERREVLADLATAYASARSYTFSRMGGIEPALEQGIVEFQWSFWQYMGVLFCDSVPDAGSTDADVFDFLQWVGTLDYFSDQLINVFEPYYYQSETQLGYPQVPTEHLADLLEYEPNTAALLPEGVNAVYDPEPMRDIAEWVRTQASELLFVYGEYDPWTAGAFDVGDNPGAQVFVAPTADHSATIADLDRDARDKVLVLLEQWLDTNLPEPDAAARAVPGTGLDMRRALLEPPRLLSRD